MYIDLLTEFIVIALRAYSLYFIFAILWVFFTLYFEIIRRRKTELMVDLTDTINRLIGKNILLKSPYAVLEILSIAAWFIPLS